MGNELGGGGEDSVQLSLCLVGWVNSINSATGEVGWSI